MKLGFSQNNLSNLQQVGSHGIEAAWAGGRNGREVMDKFFPLASDLLSPGGLFYLVTIKENKPGNRGELMSNCLLC
jgi:methylase of polypeptide subunit release factors